jgi:hypothetical protein
MDLDLKTPVSSKMARSHIEAHVAFVTDAKNSVALGQGKIWLKQFATSPGVYCIFERNELIYSGETGSLRGRMRDLLDTRNHTLRRQFGSTKFGKHASYRVASSRFKFPDDIEKLLTAVMLDRLKVNAVPVSLGRKEIEENIIDQHHPRYNIRARRGDLLDIPGV